jgi:molecular chaperone DnaJ
MTYRDPWALLAVDRSASDAEIKEAYRKKALRYHPDRNRGDVEAAALFQEIARAYSSIKNEQSRSRWIEENERAQSNITNFSESEDIKPKTIKEKVEIDFRQAFLGEQLEIIIPVEEICSRCGGSGSAPGYKPRGCEICAGTGEIQIGRLKNTCSACAGKGFLIEHPCQDCSSGIVIEKKPFVLQIPRGIYDGYKLHLAGPSRGRIGADTLVIEVSVKPSPVFRRERKEKADLTIDVPITYSEAVFGASIRIPTPNRVVEIALPGGTGSGKMFKIAGEGMPRLDSEGSGDLYARIMIQPPEKPSNKHRFFAEELAKTEDPAKLRFPLFNP